MNHFFVAVIDNCSTGIILIPRNTWNEAAEQIEQLYLKKLKEFPTYDVNNTYLDRKNGYAQIISGIEIWEYRIGRG